MPHVLNALNGLQATDFAAALAETFEHAPWVAEAAATKRPFATVTALHEAMMGALNAAPRERQLDFLRGHPDLADRAHRAAVLSRDSAREQTSAGLDQLSEEEAARLLELNGAYKA